MYLSNQAIKKRGNPATGEALEDAFLTDKNTLYITDKIPDISEYLDYFIEYKTNTIIIHDEPSTLFKSQNEILILENGRKLKEEAYLLKNKTKLIISSPGRIIDHIRRENWLMFNPQSVVVLRHNDSDNRFFQDLQFILSKIKSTPVITAFTTSDSGFNQLNIHFKYSFLKQNAIKFIEVKDKDYFKSNIQHFKDTYGLSKARIISKNINTTPINGADHLDNHKTVDAIIFLTLPNALTLKHTCNRNPGADIFIIHIAAEKLLIKRLEENLDMSTKKDKFDVDEQIIQNFMENVVKKIKEDEDPAEMDLYRKLYKKYAPFFMRGYVGAYFLKYMPKKGIRTSAKRTPSNPDMVQLFVGLGKNRRIYPKDITGLFCSVDGIEKDNIGDIKILENYSFVEVSIKKADKIIDTLNGSEYRNRRMTVNYAKRKN